MIQQGERSESRMRVVRHEIVDTRNASTPKVSSDVPSYTLQRYRPLMPSSSNQPQVLDDKMGNGSNTPVTREKIDHALFSAAPVSETKAAAKGKSAVNRSVADPAPRPNFTAASQLHEKDDRSKRKEKWSRVVVEGDREVPGEGKKRKGKRATTSAEQEDDKDNDTFEQAEAKAELRKQRKLEKARRKANAPVPILLPEYISVSNLASALKVRVEDFHTKLQELGFDSFSNSHILNAEISGLIAQEYNFEPIIERGESEDLRARLPAEDQSMLPPRPPIVTIMGHVDHGKTTILDFLRNSSVAASEHGGITQHIGAFTVAMPSGKVITFLDTPGHAAFLDMRQRGANVTDIVVLVVAADDGVKPQTIEAIKHAKAANVPIIVAINKVDKPEVDIEKVKAGLASNDVDIEDYGGDTQVVNISGKTGQGIPDLENAIVTLAEVIDMRAEVDGSAEGWVLEASVKAMGKVATILVRRGTMRVGDFIVAGKTWARIRCMRNEAGVEIDEATPGTPIEIDGWRSQPEAGDEVLQAPDEAKAKSVVDHRLEKAERDQLAVDMEAINVTRTAVNEQRREKAEADASMNAELESDAAMLDAFEDLAAKTLKREQNKGCQTVNFIIKADVSGSLEAVVNSVSAIGNGDVRPRILRSGVGRLTEFDITHASYAKGHVINFNSPIDAHIQRMADETGVKILTHTIIYSLVDSVKKELESILPPKITQRVVGEADIIQIFSIKIKGRQQKPVAGCRLSNGTIARNARIKVLRMGEKIFDGMFCPMLNILLRADRCIGTLSALKNVKKDIEEAKRGSECGISFEGWDAFREGDQIQAYEEIREKRFL